MAGLSRTAVIFVWIFFGYLASEIQAAPADILYRVVEISGQAEAFDPELSLWRMLKAEDVVSVGSRIRTGKDSAAELVSGPSFENALRIGPDSHVTFLNAVPARASLDQGSMFVLKEDPEELRVLAPDLLVSVKQGGFWLECKEGPAANLRVFADSVEVRPKGAGDYSGAPRTVEEGFQFSELSGIGRMGYPDYQEWQTWFKKNNERKDKAPSVERS